MSHLCQRIKAAARAVAGARGIGAHHAATPAVFGRGTRPGLPRTQERTRANQTEPARPGLLRTGSAEPIRPGLLRTGSAASALPAIRYFDLR